VGGGLSEEEWESKAKSLFSDYLASGSKAEALEAARELEGPGAMPKVRAVVPPGGGGAVTHVAAGLGASHASSRPARGL
jgi:hypothetical protein